MKIYSYVVASDTGFAPNPFWDYCTLATCKSKIRRIATKGDWVIGTGAVKNVGNNRLIYAMKITHILSLEDYGSDPQFVKKIPGMGRMEEKGDNIYYRDDKGSVRQRFGSMHSYADRENVEYRVDDLGGRNALISKKDHFYYFGREAPEIPGSLHYLIKKGPNHKCEFPQSVIDLFLSWIQGMKSGINAYPCDF
jgi:hypothetical protein